MKITDYGAGCKKCHEVEALVKRVVADSGSDAVAEKVSDLQAMMKMGIITTDPTFRRGSNPTRICSRLMVEL